MNDDLTQTLVTPNVAEGCNGPCSLLHCKRLSLIEKMTGEEFDKCEAEIPCTIYEFWSSRCPW